MVACVDYQCFVLHGMDFASCLYVSRCRTRGDDGFAGVSAGLMILLDASLGNFAASAIENKIQDYGTEVVFPVFGPKQDLHLDQRDRLRPLVGIRDSDDGLHLAGKHGGPFP